MITTDKFYMRQSYTSLNIMSNVYELETIRTPKKRLSNMKQIHMKKHEFRCLLHKKPPLHHELQIIKKLNSKGTQGIQPKKRRHKSYFFF